MAEIQEHIKERNARRHFETFDALRFFAFLKVFLLHLPIVAFPWFNYVKGGGGIGVQFFFVLSGFLITYIICEEKERTGSLNLKHFFVRRILRIWPLYYLMVIVAYATSFLLSKVGIQSGSEGYQPTWWVSVLFLENYKMIWLNDAPNVSPLTVMWSLCIEEHFYIVWGLLLYYMQIKALPKLIGVCLAVGIISRIIFVQYNLPTNDIFTNIDLFAFGAIPAYLLITYKEQLEAWIDKIPKIAKIIFFVVLLLVVLLASQTTSDADFVWITTLLGALFAALILLTLPAGTSFRINDKSIVGRLGVYTYGLYLYHTLVINLMRVVFEKMNINLDVWSGAVSFSIVCFLLTVICSVLSYYIFEKQFLKLKRYFR